ncbi:MAG: hypothetical protein C0483_02405 [Pirellula sp.]|nr:hypothetical protein [Pirellula sp.]
MANQNQGMTIAVIIFVILTVISMAIAVVFVQQSGELQKQLSVAEKKAKDSSDLADATTLEFNEVKEIIMPAADSNGVAMSAVSERFKADLKKHGDRLKNIATETTVPQSYSQMLDSAMAALDQRNTALEAERVRLVDTEKQKASLQGTYEAQVTQFKQQADAVVKEKADLQSKLTSSEERLKNVQLEVTAKIDQSQAETQKVRQELQKTIDDQKEKILQLEGALAKLNERLTSFIEVQFAATYDGEVTKVNPSARTVWINLGSYDNLPKSLTFSVQARGVPAGSQVPPKAKLEVTEILSDHLAECRIIEDDLRNPILPGDNIFTQMWAPGQRTRFAFAGKIDIDNNGSDDMDRVRAMVARAGGQIDAEVVNGELRGKLDIETRYLVLGAVPADKNSADRYNELTAEAERLGIQRVPMAVFFDQIGYKREARTQTFGSGASGTRDLEAPDGGQRVSNGRVTPIFERRKPPAAIGGSSY